MLSRHIYCVFNRFSGSKAGKVLTWGTTGFGYGRLGQKTSLDVPGEVSGIEEPITKVSTGRYHTLFLSQSHSVYGVGLNTAGQIGDFPKIVEKPVKLEYFNKNNITVKKIRTGNYHNLALNDSGNVFTWGSNSKSDGILNHVYSFGNCLGFGKLGKMATRTPTQIEDLNDVVEITAGDTFSLALLKDGRVFGWGSPYEGRLLDTLEPYFKPTELSSLTQFLNKKHAHIKKIKSSGSYTVILTDNGKLYSWGRSYFGANGARPNALINETEIYQDVTPVIDEAYKGQKVVDFKLSPFALIFTTDKGNVYYTGLGLAYKPIAFPKQLQDIKDTFATLNSVGVISNNNEVFYINDKLIEDSDQDPHNKVYVSEDSNLKGDIKAIGGKYEVNYAIVA